MPDGVNSHLTIAEIAALTANPPLVDIVVLGQPYSKANSRRWTGRLFIKSDEARAYADQFALQVGVREPLLTNPLLCVMRINYKTHRPDLDESLILDLMQGRIYCNDRQVRARITTHGISKENPGCRIMLWELPIEPARSGIRRARAGR